MKSYTLYNKLTDNNLVHPKVGLWYTTDLEEAKAMLKDCHGYLDYIKVPSMKDKIVIVDAETGEEVDS
jgi:hypothetical protein